MIKINMGCGWRNFGKEWVHIDGGNYDHLDYGSITDLSDFEDNSVDLIYSSHVIGYFDRDSVKGLLLEWKRILKKDGILRIAIPDFCAMASLYLKENISIDKFLGPLYGKMEMKDATIYHKTCYDLKSLSFLLTELGFRDILLYDWKKTSHSHFDDHSQAYIPHMDKENGTLISLNVECKK